MLRHGLRQAMAQHPNLTFAGEASTGELGLKLAKESNPDLVVMDLYLPDMSGIEATRRILAAVPATKVIFFSSDAVAMQVDEALRAGGSGYVSKSSAMEELFRAIDIVMAGKLYLTPRSTPVSLMITGRASSAGPGRPNLS